MNRAQFVVLYREFLFRVVDLEILAPQGDITKLLGQFAALLITVSLGLVLVVTGVASAERVPELGLIGSWIAEHFLIATTMLVVGLFAVMSWEATFPDRRGVLVLSPLPVRARTLFAAKAAAVATALGITVAALNCFTGLAAPFAFAEAPAAPPPQYDAAIAPVEAGEMRAVLNRDLASAPPCLATTGCGIAIGVAKHGERQIITYGVAQPDSIYEIGSITKTFTALLLAKMTLEGRARLDEPLRNLLPPGLVAKPQGAEITLLDLATHHSGLPRMPDNFGGNDVREAYANYHAADLYEFLAKHGLGKPANPQFRYSNLGFGLLGVALANRAGTTYENLLKAEITGPLGLSDTAITLTPEQRERLIQAYDLRPWPVPGWDLDAFAGAGAIRSTAADLLTYVEAQLHPERLGPLGAAIRQTQQLRSDAFPDMKIGLSWMFDLKRGVYAHGGAISAYTSVAFFDPKHDYAGVALFNEQSPAGFVGILGEHLSQRLAGRPAVRLTAPVVASHGGVAAALRCFAAYWIAMLASGVFLLAAC
ncbi:MAG TPA: serine hydrolase domain-containing protein [Bryobacteraceae bacterium]|jgi:CubicO group peptidase (beta-lactamase class C family)